VDLVVDELHAMASSWLWTPARRLRNRIVKEV